MKPGTIDVYFIQDALIVVQHCRGFFDRDDSEARGGFIYEKELPFWNSES